tara:strand:+ start:1045 stop:1461 length:417 start_codon:yes stop_codon:yes gene_type:complete
MSNNDNFVNKLRSSGLRPTRQRIQLCKVLFDRDKTFHFTVENLAKMLKKNFDKKVSLATVYNTVHVLKNKGYLKEISINNKKTYFDTNISHHHHFFNENTNELIDLNDKEIGPIKIKKTIPGKKIKSVEVLVKIANSN